MREATKQKCRELIPAWSAASYRALVRVNASYSQLTDDEWFALELLAVRADERGVVVLHPHEVPHLLGVKSPDTVKDQCELRGIVAAFRDARASLVRGGWLIVRRFRGGTWTYRLTLPRGEPREHLERKHLYLPLQDRPRHLWRRPKGRRSK